MNIEPLRVIELNTANLTDFSIRTVNPQYEVLSIQRLPDGKIKIITPAVDVKMSCSDQEADTLISCIDKGLYISFR